MWLLLLFIIVNPILNWYALKTFVPKMKKLKRIPLWFVTTWASSIAVFITYYAVT
jgi:hypothetical protein